MVLARTMAAPLILLLGSAFGSRAPYGCGKIEVSGQRVGRLTNGMYERTLHLSGGQPVFADVRTGRNTLYFSDRYQMWMIGTHVGSTSAYLAARTSHAGMALAPPTQGWNAFSHGHWVPARAARVRCVCGAAIGDACAPRPPRKVASPTTTAATTTPVPVTVTTTAITATAAAAAFVTGNALTTAKPTVVPERSSAPVATLVRPHGASRAAISAAHPVATRPVRVPTPAPCARVMLVGQQPGDPQASAMGTYALVSGAQSAERPVYKREEGGSSGSANVQGTTRELYLYSVALKLRTGQSDRRMAMWVVSDTIGMASGWLYAVDDAPRPQGVRAKWHAVLHAGGTRSSTQALGSAGELGSWVLAPAVRAGCVGDVLVMGAGASSVGSVRNAGGNSLSAAVQDSRIGLGWRHGANLAAGTHAVTRGTLLTAPVSADAAVAGRGGAMRGAGGADAMRDQEAGGGSSSASNKRLVTPYTLLLSGAAVILLAIMATTVRWLNAEARALWDTRYGAAARALVPHAPLSVRRPDQVVDFRGEGSRESDGSGRAGVGQQAYYSHAQAPPQLQPDSSSQMPSTHDVAANTASPDSSAARRERRMARRREHFTAGESADGGESNFSEAGAFYSL